jgi:hypothetical protein
MYMNGVLLLELTRAPKACFEGRGGNKANSPSVTKSSSSWAHFPRPMSAWRSVPSRLRDKGAPAALYDTNYLGTSRLHNYAPFYTTLQYFEHAPVCSLQPGNVYLEDVVDSYLKKRPCFGFEDSGLLRSVGLSVQAYA